MSPTGVEELARRAADWLLADDHVGPQNPTLYSGLAGVVLALHQAHACFGDDRYAAAVDEGADALARWVDQVDDCSLFFGLGGIAVALHAVGQHPPAIARARELIRQGFDGERWGPMFELLSGNAGIGLAALELGDMELAVMAVTPYLSAFDETQYGVNWPVRPSPPRSHHVAHGTLGIVSALARVGEATGRQDMIDLALAGAADVVGRNEQRPDGFLVPHSDPQHRPELIERYSYGWCNGPAGDAQVFRMLGRITCDPRWRRLEDACWHTVRTSGLPRRTRPGLWDNHGRCCGTAGVLALACDRLADGREDDGFAAVLVNDLASHGIQQDGGVCWSNHEHRAEPNDLPPEAGWAMGNAGILPELLRYARLTAGLADLYTRTWSWP